ncbi:WapI family immunity protein [Cellulomonas denverensis]
MRLWSRDGACLEMYPTGYQYPDPPPGAVWPHPWFWHDCNWVMVGGEIELANGDHWSFHDPCMTASEAEDFAEWLHAVAVCPGSGGTLPGRMSFIEPLFTFDVVSVRGGEIALRVKLTHEALPAGPDRYTRRPVVYELWMDRRVVDWAADEWRRALAAVPPRWW